MKNELKNIYEDLNKIFVEKIKDEEDLTAVCLISNGEATALCYSGTNLGVYEMFAQFLITQPEHLEVIKTAVECAEEYHAQKNTPLAGQTVGEA